MSSGIPGIIRVEPRCKVCSVPGLAAYLTKDLLLRRKTFDEILNHYNPMYVDMGKSPLNKGNLIRHKRHCHSKEWFALEHLRGPSDSPHLELPPKLAEVLEVGDIGEDVKLVNEFVGLEIVVRNQFNHLFSLWDRVEKAEGDGGVTASLHKALVSAQKELRTSLVEKARMREPGDRKENVVVPILIREITKVIFAEIPDLRSQRRIAASIGRAHEFALKGAKKVRKEGGSQPIVDAHFVEVPPGSEGDDNT